MDEEPILPYEGNMEEEEEDRSVDTPENALKEETIDSCSDMFKDEEGLHSPRNETESSEKSMPPTKAKPYGVNRFINWMQEKEIQCTFSSISAEEMNKLLQQFYSEVGSVQCDKSLSHNTLLCMRYSIHKYLTDPPFSRTFDVVRGEEFVSANAAFRVRFKQLREDPTDSSVITKDDLIRLARYFSHWSTSSQVLVETSWFYLNHTFRNISHPNWRLMRKDAFNLRVDASGCLYVAKENVLATGEEERMYGISVDIFVFYLSKLGNTNLLFQPPGNTRYSLNLSNDWYRGVPFGQDRFGRIFKIICKNASLQQMYRKQNLIVSDITIVSEKLMEYQQAKGNEATLLEMHPILEPAMEAVVPVAPPPVIEVSPVYSPTPLTPRREISPDILSREPFGAILQPAVTSAPDCRGESYMRYSTSTHFNHMPFEGGDFHPSCITSKKENRPSGDVKHSIIRPGFHSGLPQVLPVIPIQANTTLSKNKSACMKRPFQDAADTHELPHSKVVKDLSFSSATSSVDDSPTTTERCPSTSPRDDAEALKAPSIQPPGSRKFIISMGLKKFICQSPCTPNAVTSRKPISSSASSCHSVRASATTSSCCGSKQQEEMSSALDDDECFAHVKKEQSEPVIALDQYSTTEQRMHYDKAMSSEMLLTMVRSFVPPLTDDLHKGQCGRIGIVGGCKQYTGAPYYAAISALKVGADLSNVFCSTAAAPVIKAYSPELIVHPVLDVQGCVEEVGQLLPRLHVLVIGPGLGRETPLLNAVKGIMAAAREQGIPMVIDADGVFLVTEDPSIIHGNTNVILTPNAVEFSRLYNAVLRTPDPDDVSGSDVSTLSSQLGNVTIVRKGKTDLISNGHSSHVLECSVPGSGRRCGGQGDLLAGALGTFLHWAHNSTTTNPDFRHYGPSLSAAYAACALTRACNHRAFSQLGRAMTTPDMVTHIHGAFAEMFEGSS